jgi:hypothetical protein
MTRSIKLGMECAMLGVPWAGPILLGIVGSRLGNVPDRETLDFYGAFRALLRARLSIAHLLDPVARDHRKWKPLALSYVAKAMDELNPPCPAGRQSTPAHGDA